MWERAKHCLMGLALGLAPLYAGSAIAGDFAVREAKTHLSDHVYLLDAQIDFELSEQAREALNNGIPITIRIDIKVQRKRGWWLPDADVAALEQRYRIHYHALSEQFLVLNLNSSALYAHSTLGSALEALGTIRDFPLLDDKLISKGEQYEVELKARLDIEALPSPLRPLAYINPAWRLSSDWYVWSLEP